MSFESGDGGSSSGSASPSRCSHRIRSSAQRTTIDDSQVRRDDRASNDFRPRTARHHPSCSTSSAADSEPPVMRSASRKSAGECSRYICRNACSLPRTTSRISAASSTPSTSATLTTATPAHHAPHVIDARCFRLSRSQSRPLPRGCSRGASQGPRSSLPRETAAHSAQSPLRSGTGSRS